MQNCSIDWQSRYAKDWPKISKKTRQTTGNRCCLCGKKAEVAHHALYADKKGLIAGREQPGCHVFPLCEGCHSEAHSPLNWVISRNNPAEKNRNSPAFYLRLRAGWLKYTDLYRLSNLEMQRWR